MSYPLIILGAGASFDYVAEIREAKKAVFLGGPPLTKDIFDKRFEVKTDLFVRKRMLMFWNEHLQKLIEF